MADGTEVKVLKAHLALNVRDVERSIEFYRKMLGIEPSKVRTGYAKFDVQNPPLNLTLNQHQFNEQGALSHLGLQVSSTEDVLAVRGRWQEVGLLPQDEMQTSCCFAVQDKAWVKDPDGYEWEVFVVLGDNLPESAGAGACCTTNEGAKLDATGAEVPAAGTCSTSPAETAAASAATGSCGCTAVPPPVGQVPCCDTQAATFGISR